MVQVLLILGRLDQQIQSAHNNNNNNNLRSSSTNTSFGLLKNLEGSGFFNKFEYICGVLNKLSAAQMYQQLQQMQPNQQPNQQPKIIHHDLNLFVRAMDTLKVKFVDYDIRYSRNSPFSYSISFLSLFLCILILFFPLSYCYK